MQQKQRGRQEGEKCPRVGYPRAAVVKWLDERAPIAGDSWEQVLSDAPPVIMRSNWPKMKEKYGVPYAAARLRVLDCLGDGIRQVAEELAEKKAGRGNARPAPAEITQ